ncbi:hypothetical protein HJ01_03046 [Flavobacterium frigoris PS1]|uniref:Uncharacterized protein n=1 Tax=Flavobacterium frigoris (strain PS1) TaxID=1086011 RepID=H7FV48_FLAFP|nr:hypothetical protein HJ01_03046 [Flavobacterium frigoris PS1]
MKKIKIAGGFYGLSALLGHNALSLNALIALRELSGKIHTKKCMN